MNDQTQAPEPEQKPRRGPNTEEGKRRVSMNALKHGLTAKSPQALEAMHEACQETFEQTLDRMRTHYMPRDQVEDELVIRIARCLWRLKMATAMEGRVISNNPAMGRPGVSYDKIMRFERLVDIHLHRAIATLQAKREFDNRQHIQNSQYPRSF